MNRSKRERRGGRPAPPFAAVCAALWVMTAASCQTHESGVEPESRAEARMRGVGTRLDEEVLSEVGLETLWFNPPPGGEHPVTGAYLADDGLYLATQPVRGAPGRLKKLSRDDGMTSWYYDLDGPLNDPPTVYRYAPASAQPGTSNELFLVVNDTVHCLGLEHGDLLWKRATPFTISTSVAANEQRIIAGSENKRIYGVLKNRSVVNWTYLTGGFVEADPVAQGSSVYVGSTDGTLYRFSGAAGWREGFSWSFQTGARIVAAPVLFGQWVLVGSADYNLYCLNTGDGSVVWKFLAEAPILDIPVVYSLRAGQEFAYCVTTDKQRGGETRTLFAVRMRDGREQWRRDGVRKVVSFGERDVYVLSDPATSGGDRVLLALDAASGRERFRLDVHPGFRFVPTNVADHGRNRKERGRIYLVGGDGTVQAIGER